ncbi:olfactory receptor 10G4-like [Salarias fasciatus]|nr:olfactory receptor 10G4-like [Salarias fasciatus]
MDNVSMQKYFTLSGLNYAAQHRIVLFALTLLCYSVIWMVNAALILTIIVDRKLHEPMYIFLCNLCISGLYGTVGFYPKFLLDLLSPSHIISYTGCLLQSFVIHSSSGSDLSILTVMAFDRYVAICYPLMYHSVMTRQRITLLVAFSWLLPLFCMFSNMMSVFQIKLCGSLIPKLYCSNSLISKLACNVSMANNSITYFNIVIYSFHLLFVLWSYLYLVHKCLGSKENRKKFSQTCVPHLVSLLNFCFAVLFDMMYSRFGLGMLPLGMQNFMAIEYLVIPPIVNPLVYGFNLTKIRSRISGLWRSKKRASCDMLPVKHGIIRDVVS